MSFLYVVTCVAASVLLSQVDNTVGQPDSSSGYRLPNLQEFLVLAPLTVRPEQVYEMHMTIYKLHYGPLTVRSILSCDGEEYASASEMFFDRGTKQIQLKVPVNVIPGKHKLTVEGLVGEEGQPVFHNETLLRFQSKYVSLFIQTDKPVYYPGQPVYFRIIGVFPGNLKPVYGSMTIYLRDSKQNIVRRWLQKQLNFGIFSEKFELTYPTNIGQWSIEVDAFGHKYTQPFMVDFYYPRAFEVNVTTPMYIFDTEWGVAGLLYGEHVGSGKAASGNMTIECRVIDENGVMSEDALTQRRAHMEGTVPFEFTMKQIREQWGSVAGKQLFFKAWIFDWYFMETQNGTAVTKVLKDGIQVKMLGRKLRTFRPGVPFSVQFAIQRTDGTPYNGFYNRHLVIQRSHEGNGVRAYPEEKKLIPDDSVVTLQVMPTEQDQRIIIRAWHPNFGAAEEIWVYRYFNKNKRYLSVTSTTETPTTDQYMIFTVRMNFFAPEVNYLISANGNILLGSTLTMNTNQKTFSVALSRDMAPRARMVVYTVQSGDVLLDSLNFYIKDSQLMTASIDVNYGKDFSQDTIEILGQGAPGAFIGLNGLDYEWYRRGAAQWTSFLTEERVVRELMTYDYPNEGPYEHTWHYDNERWEGTVYYPANTNGMDTLTTLEAAGLVALSDMNMTEKQEYSACNRSLGLGLCPSGQCYKLTKKCDGVIDCLDGYDEMACPILERREPRPPEISNLSKMNRFYQEGDWAWKVTYIKHTGQIEIKLDIPKSTNPTVISAFVLHPEHGLSLVKQPCQHDTTRRFFMLAEAPPLIRRGEQVGIRLSIFNNWDQDLETIVTLHGGENYRFVHVEDFGIVSSYKPRTSSGDIQTMLSLRSGQQSYLFMPVVASIEAGEITVVCSVYSVIEQDTVEVTIEVAYDGIEQDDHIPYLIDLVNKGSVLIPDFDIPIPERFVEPGQRDHLYIPGSNGAVVQIFGEVVLPGFFEDYLTCDSTAGVPHDSAEGYMYDYAINLVTLKYLQALNVLDDNNLDSALEYMISILAREYAYMQDDGSFKQFRRTDSPCLWVSAFVLKYLHATVMTEWGQTVYIQLEILNKIALWITKQQNTTTGAFKETSEYIYDRNFLPESTDIFGQKHEWNIPVTAQVVITLALCTRLTGEAKTRADAARNFGADYLASKLSLLTDPFQIAITGWALHVAKHRDKDNAYSLLKSIQRETEFIYWAAVEITPNPTTIINTVPIMQPREDFDNLENAVMATSYGLMMYLAHNEFESSRPIMKWLVSQHNGLANWASTQDTLLAIEALTEYALRETNRDIYQMEIRLESTKDPDWKHKVVLNKTNWAQLYEFELENAWGQVKAHAIGTGYAFIGLTDFYSVEKDYLVIDAGPGFDAYDLNVDSLRFYGRNASNMEMTVCTSWIRPDLGEQSGMMNVMVEVPTGFVVDRDSIEKLYNDHVPGMKRVRFRDQTLIVFFEYLTQEKTCFTFMAERWYPVANVSIAHGITAMEYSETAVHFPTAYETYTLFHLHICQVCGSFQCPYCQYYNTATTLTSPLLITILMTSLILLRLVYDCHL